MEAQRALPVLWVGGPDVAPRYRFRALQPTADEANGRGVWADLSDEEVRLLPVPRTTSPLFTYCLFVLPQI